MSPDAQGIDLILNRLDGLARIIQGKLVSSWLTTREAAAFIRCSKSKIDRLVAAGDLRFYRQNPSVARSPRLFHRKDLTAFLVTGKNPAFHRLTHAEKQQVEDML